MRHAVYSGTSSDSGRLQLLAWFGVTGITALLAAAPPGISLATLLATMATLVFMQRAQPGWTGRLTFRSGRSQPAGGGSRLPDDARHFMEREFAAAQRGRNVAVVLFGFRAFDEYTERLGTAAADAALMEFGSLLQRLTRRMNLSARYGWRGEAFLSVLSDADLNAAQAVVRRVRDAATRAEPRLPEIEAAIVVYQPHMTSPEELIATAERLLARELS